MKMLSGYSIVDGESQKPGKGTFAGFNPATGQSLEPEFHYASLDDLNRAADLAEEAFDSYRNLPGKEKGKFLRHIAAGLEAIEGELVSRANAETALPEARLKSELARTVNQLRLFAQVVEEGSWVDARIDPAQPDRKPAPRSDIRSMLRPLGPIAVFGASNFPLAFSVAGGDTASALAAGNPVIVKAHSAHPGTSELVGQTIAHSVQENDLHPGTFALLFGQGNELGAALVKHPKVKGVGFTGSLRGGKALMEMCAARPEPIPCFTEMSSVNPVFILPEALRTRAAQIAAGLFGSFTLGVGQFCTKPGLVFLPRGEHADALVSELKKLVQGAACQPMLTEDIARSYREGVEELDNHAAVETLARAAAPGELKSCHAVPALFEISGKKLMSHPELAGEVFGPTTLIVRFESREEMLALARGVEGQLTATLHGTEHDLTEYPDLIGILEGKAGRLIVNGFPTGVEVCHAMVHGGPFPAASDSRFTSVGTRAIRRWVRPVCYQDLPQCCLLDELKNENPLGILRMINGYLTRDAVGHENDALHGRHVFAKS
jgi:alpha-ketoglutaric semialdehyde dehydrogenase